MSLKVKSRGFTLTELIVVTVIIGILASVLIPATTVFIKKSKISANQQEAMEIKKLIDMAILEERLTDANLSETTPVQINVRSYADFELVSIKSFYQDVTGKTLASNVACKVSDGKIYYSNRGICIAIDLETLVTTEEEMPK